MILWTLITLFLGWGWSFGPKNSRASCAFVFVFWCAASVAMHFIGVDPNLKD
jgi:hypothetical protein